MAEKWGDVAPGRINAGQRKMLENDVGWWNWKERDKRCRKRKAAKRAKLLERGEKTEPITQVKGLGLPEGGNLPWRKEKNQTLVFADFWGGRVHSVWWEWGQKSRTLYTRLWLRGCHIRWCEVQIGIDTLKGEYLEPSRPWCHQLNQW